MSALFRFTWRADPTEIAQARQVRRDVLAAAECLIGSVSVAGVGSLADDDLACTTRANVLDDSDAATDVVRV